MSINQLVQHYSSFLNTLEAEEYFSLFKALIPWQICSFSPNSRKVFMWNSSGLMSSSTDPQLSMLFQKLIDKIQSRFGVQIENLFCNLYEDGSNYCSYHKDKYGMNIYTLSLGAPRDFSVKPDGKNTTTKTFLLESGDLYFMDNAIHKTHKHSIPKRTKCKDSRISIVFFVSG